MKFIQREVSLTVFIVAVFIIGAALIYVVSEVFNIGLPPLLPSATVSLRPSDSPTTFDQETEAQITELINGFYQAIEKQDCGLFFGYFTPPQTEQEKRDYEWAIGADLSPPACRIFLRTRVSGFNIQKIIKVSESIYKIELTEQSQWWNNAGEVGWSESEELKKNIIAVKVNDLWKVDKYTFDCGESVCGGNTTTDKYNGSGQ